MIDAHGLLAELRRQAIPMDDLEVIHKAVDEQHHWCTPEFSRDELQAYNRPFRLIKRFVIAQASPGAAAKPYGCVTFWTKPYLARLPGQDLIGSILTIRITLPLNYGDHLVQFPLCS